MILNHAFKLNQHSTIHLQQSQLLTWVFLFGFLIPENSANLRRIFSIFSVFYIHLILIALYLTNDQYGLMKFESN